MTTMKKGTFKFERGTFGFRSQVLLQCLPTKWLQWPYMFKIESKTSFFYKFGRKFSNMSIKGITKGKTYVR